METNLKELEEFGDWGFTLTIPPFKKVQSRMYWNKQNKICRSIAYGDMTPPDQKGYLDVTLSNHIHKDDNIKYYFEHHKDGRYHVHGIAKDNTISRVIQILTAFYNEVGLKRYSNFSKYFDLRQLNNTLEWEHYITKFQPNELQEQEAVKEQMDIYFDIPDFSKYQFGKVK